MTNSRDDDATMVPLGDAYELLKLRAVREVEQEVLDRARLRFFWISVVVAVLSLVGVNAIGYVVIQGVLGKKIEDATIAVELSKDALKRSNEATQAASQKAQQVGKLADSMNDRIAALRSQIEDTTTRSQAAVEIARTGLQEQFDELIKQIRLDLGREDSLAKIEKTRKAADEARDLFKDNSRYKVGMAYRGNIEEKVFKLAKILREKGFKAIQFGWAETSRQKKCKRTYRTISTFHS